MCHAVSVHIGHCCTVEGVAVENGTIAAVEVITGKRTADVGEVDANLVGASGLKADLRQGKLSPFQHLKMCHSRFAVRRDAAFDEGTCRPADGGGDGAMIGRIAADKGEIGLLQLEVCCGDGMFGNGTESGRIAVKPMDGTEGQCRKACGEGIAEGVEPVVEARMDGHAGRLVKEQQVIILKQQGDVEVGIGLDVGDIGYMQGDAVARMHGVDAPDGLSVAEHAVRDVFETAQLAAGQTAVMAKKRLEAAVFFPLDAELQCGHGVPPPATPACEAAGAAHNW